MNEHLKYIIYYLKEKKKEYLIALKWIKEKQRCCFILVSDVLINMDFQNSLDYIKNQIKLLENEIEKARIWNQDKKTN